MPSLPTPTLMLVTDRKLAGGENSLVAKVRDAVAGGANVVQLREKDMNAHALAALARRLKDAIGGQALLIVNSAADVALEVGANGVHLPEGSRQIRTDKQMILGRSVHSVKAARAAAGAEADYVIAGPAYETASHPGAAASGVGLIADVAAAVTVPVVAIGGIDASRVAEVMGAGASGVAVVSAILGAGDAESAARELWEALGSRTSTATRG